VLAHECFAIPSPSQSKCLQVVPNTNGDERVADIY
jgi:hypothetical protein